MTELQFYKWKQEQESAWYVCVKKIHPNMSDEDRISIWGFMAIRFNDVRLICDKKKNR